MDKPKTIPALDGLRMIAAVAVVGYHYAPHVVGFSRLPLFVQNLVSCGPIAVPFFFILSGSVLSHAYQHRPPLTKEERKQFWWGRLARLYPVYLLAWVLFLPMAYAKYLGHMAAHGGNQVNQMATFTWSGLLSLLGLQAWTPLSQSWNGPSWSLSVEMLFYFLFPFLALPLLTIPLERALLVAVTAWALMLGPNLCHVTGVLSKQMWVNWFYANPLLSLPTFLMGIVTCRVHRRSASLSSSSVAFVVGVLCLVVLAGKSSESSRNYLIGGGAAPLMAFVILTAAHGPRGVLLVFGNPTLAKLGTTSFIVYIMQAPVWHVTRLIADRLHLESTGHDVALTVFVVYLSVLVGLALLLQAWLETPARNWLMSRTRVPQRALSTTTA